MKKVNKKLNIFGYALVIVLVFLCGINVSYAYFTARATVQGSLDFYDLNIQFAYTNVDDGMLNPISTGETEYEIIPNSAGIFRGVEFGFKTSSNQGIQTIGLMSMDNSCNWYARVKIKAVKTLASGSTYVEDSTDTTDYGEFIILNTAINTDVKFNSADNYYYFMSEVNAEEQGGFSYQPLATAAKISTSAPPDITNGYLKISLLFEAVQADKQAVISTFGNAAATFMGL